MAPTPARNGPGGPRGVDLSQRVLARGVALESMNRVQSRGNDTGRTQGGLGTVAQDESQLLQQLSLDTVATRHPCQQLEQPDSVRAKALITHGDQGARVGVLVRAHLV